MKVINTDFFYNIMGLVILMAALFFSSNELFAGSNDDHKQNKEYSSDNGIRKRTEEHTNAADRSNSTTPRDRDPNDSVDKPIDYSSGKSIDSEQINPNTPSSGINDATTQSQSK